MKIRCFSELIGLSTFEARYEYLKLSGSVGQDTFGEDRYLNQRFYQSTRWRDIRDVVIVRDRGFDLGCDGYALGKIIIVHHMNPILPEDIINFNDTILDPEFLISTSPNTHMAIHYADDNLLPRLSFVRKPGDTRLW